MCLFMCGWIGWPYVGHRVYVGTRRQLGVSSLLPLCGFQGLNFSCQGQQQAPVLGETHSDPPSALWGWVLGAGVTLTL